METQDVEVRWMRKVAKLYPAAKGSLREVRKNCSHPGCKVCSSGERHPAWLLTYYLDGKQCSKHVPKKIVGVMKKALANGRKLEDLMVASGLEVIDAYKKR